MNAALNTQKNPPESLGIPLRVRCPKLLTVISVQEGLDYLRKIQAIDAYSVMEIRNGLIDAAVKQRIDKLHGCHMRLVNPSKQEPAMVSIKELQEFSSKIGR